MRLSTIGVMQKSALRTTNSSACHSASKRSDNALFCKTKICFELLRPSRLPDLKAAESVLYQTSRQERKREYDDNEDAIGLI